MKLFTNLVGTRCCASALPARIGRRAAARPCRHGESGSAIVLVFALVVILAAILASNQSVLNHTKRELKLIEQQQLKKFQPPPKPAQP